jgi:hypothetical protein
MPSSLALDFSDYVRILNNSDQPIQGRYDGRDYRWEPHGYLDVHKVVAVHIFGFIPPEVAEALKEHPDRLEDIKTRAMMRLGWLKVGEDFASARQRLTAIRITPVPMPENLRVLRPEDPHLMPRVEAHVPGIAGGSESRTADAGEQPPAAVPIPDVSPAPVEEDAVVSARSRKRLT